MADDISGCAWSWSVRCSWGSDAGDATTDCESWISGFWPDPGGIGDTEPGRDSVRARGRDGSTMGLLIAPESPPAVPRFVDPTSSRTLGSFTSFSAFGGLGALGVFAGFSAFTGFSAFGILFAFGGFSAFGGFGIRGAFSAFAGLGGLSPFDCFGRNARLAGLFA